MWQCSKCDACQADPKANAEHIEKCKAKSKPSIVGWQGLSLDGIPVSKAAKVPLSELYEKWKNIQNSADNTK
jgi:hypothetical protein